MPQAKAARHVPLSTERASAMAESLKSHRERARLTQEGLAHAAGVSVMHVSRIERGIANPTVATLCALADVMNIRPSALLPD